MTILLKAARDVPAFFEMVKVRVEWLKSCVWERLLQKAIDHMGSGEAVELSTVLVRPVRHFQTVVKKVSSDDLTNKSEKISVRCIPTD